MRTHSRRRTAVEGICMRSVCASRCEREVPPSPAYTVIARLGFARACVYGWLVGGGERIKTPKGLSLALVVGGRRRRRFWRTVSAAEKQRNRAKGARTRERHTRRGRTRVLTKKHGQEHLVCECLGEKCKTHCFFRCFRWCVRISP